MLDMRKIVIRTVNEIGIAYGDPIDTEACRDVADAVENEILTADADEGEILIGGERYHWRRADLIDWTRPVLRVQSTDCTEPVAARNATPAEIEASRQAGPEGYIEVPDLGTCWVEE